MKNAVFRDVAQCRSCVNRRFGGTYHLHIQGKDHIASIFRVRLSETSVHTRPTLRHIPEDEILHSHRRENLKSYMISRMFLLSPSVLHVLSI
jgi:hypothetical protein